MNYVISTWDHKKDNAVKVLFEGNWNQIVDVLKNYVETNDKYSVPLFNLNKFDALTNKTADFVECRRTRQWVDRRTKDNVRLITGFVIDYDNDSILQKMWSIDEVSEKFKDYEHLIYTSYSHWKHEHIDKFRLVVPLEEPLEVTSGDDYDRWAQSIKDFFGYEEPEDLPEEMWYENENGVVIKRDKPAIDKVSFVPSQGFFIPSCPVGHKVIYKHNKGRFLPLSTFKKGPKVEIKEVDFDIQKNTMVGGDGTILKHTFDAVRYFKENSLYLRQVGSDKHQVICPWYQEHTKMDKTGTVILKKNNRHVLYCHHNHSVSLTKLIDELGEEARPYCLTRALDPIGDFVRSKKKETHSLKAVEESLISIDEAELAVPFKRDKRLQMVKKAVKEILTKNHHITVEWAFEGFGKTYSVVEFLKQSKAPVVIASFSNNQARAVKEDFERYGYDVQLIRGRADKLFEDYKIEAEMDDPQHPWDTENVNKSKTIKKIMTVLQCSKFEAEEIWTATAPEEPDFENYRIVSTTIKRTQVWGRIQATRLKTSFKSNELYIDDDDRIVPAGTMVFFDDPDKHFFCDLTPYNEEFKDAQIDGRPLEVVTRLDKEWFVRPISYRLGYGLMDTRLVFTTTETMVKELIDKSYPNPFYPEFIPQGKKMEAGNITMIKTKMTKRDCDGLLPVLVKRADKIMKKKGDPTDVVYIANGQGMVNNLSTTRGKNEFIKCDTVIEISMPQFDVVEHYLAEFNVGRDWAGFMRAWIALDALQQAIGRNSGYRWVDLNESERRQCIVLCEPRLFNSLIAMMRYHVQTVIKDPQKIVSRKEEFESIVHTICWLITYTKIYMQSGVGGERNAFRNDLNDVISDLPLNNKILFKRRISRALTKMRDDSEPSLQKVIDRVLDVVA